LLEVTLRNKIDNTLSSFINENWILDEFFSPTLLLTDELPFYKETYKKCIIKKARKWNKSQGEVDRPHFIEIKNIKILSLFEEQSYIKYLLKKLSDMSIPLNKGDLIPELNFGFWVNLCKKGYNRKFWQTSKIFNEAFPYFEEFLIEKPKKRIGYIQKKLKPILDLRNRISHHEPIMFNTRLIQQYEDIEELLILMSNDISDLLNKVSRFKKL